MTSTRKFVFNKNPSVSGFYTIRTSNILETTWEYLGRYKSVAYTKANLTQNLTAHKHLIDKKAEQIAYTMRQAQEFFSAAHDADLSIKPLLIYYGILGLAKCLIISGDNEYTLEATPLDYDEHGTHGLNWKAKTLQQIQDRDTGELSKEFCTVKQKGIYPLFRGCYSNTPIANNTQISLEILLSLIGENWKTYNTYFSKPPSLYGADAPKDGGAEVTTDDKQILGRFNDYYYLFHRTANETVDNCLDRLFPELKSLYDRVGDYSYKSKSSVTAIDSHIVFSKTLTLEVFALVQPFNNFKLCDFDVYFLLFFILSNLARYRQDKWYKIVKREAIPDEFFLVESLFEIVQYKFPLLILRELENKDYRFIGSVATYG